ncbi:MAG: DUF3971 domain-containing protein [Candidatus Sumerlaeota bacterium]|nr:DUF3971 domain-containing protein [Candidatus Sumerlaeota bacterium]
MMNQPPKPRRRRRWILGIALALFGLLVAGGAALYYIPFHAEFLDKRVRGAFLRATGLWLRFDSMEVCLARRRFLLDNLQVVDPEDGQVLAWARQIEFQSGWRVSRSDSLRRIKRLRVEEPSPLTLIADSRGLAPAGALRRLLNSQPIDRVQAIGSGDESAWRVDSLELTRAAVSIRDPRHEDPMIRLERANVEGWWKTPKNFRFDGSGELALRAQDETTTTTWRGSVSALNDGGGLRVSNQFDRLAAEDALRFDFPLGAAGENVRLDGEIRPAAAGGVNLGVNLSARQLVLLNRRSRRSLPMSDVHLATNASYEPASNTLELRRLAADSANLDFSGCCNMGLSEPYAYDLTLDRIAAREPLLRWLKEFSPELCALVDYQGGALTASGRARGSLARPRPEQVDANLTLANVNLQVAALPMPLRNLSGTLRFDARSLRSDRLEGSFGQSHVKLAVAITGETPSSLLEGRPRQLDLAWDLQGHGDDLVALLAQADPATISGLASAGDVESSGSLTADFGSSPTLQAAARSLQVRGAARLNGFRLETPWLPAPLENVSGYLDVDNRSVRCRDLRGSALGSTVKVSGTIQSEPYFWSDPKADLVIAGRLDLERVAEAIRRQVKEKQSVPAISGQADTELRVAGELRQSKTIQVTGQVRLNDGRLSDPRLPAPIDKIHGYVDVKNQALESRDLKGSALGSTIEVNGTIRGAPYFWSRPKVDLKFSGDVDTGRLAPVIQERLGNSVALPPLQGMAGVQARLAGDLAKPESLQYSGDVEMRKLAAELRSGGLSGRIEGIEGSLSLRDDKIILRNTRFSIGDARYALNAELSRADLVGDLKLVGPLRTIAAAHPGPFRPFQTAGDIDLQAVFHLGLGEPERAAALADTRRPCILAFLDGVHALYRRSFDDLETATRLFLEMDGEIKAHDVEMTYVTFPDRIRRVNGVVRLGKDAFSAANLRLFCGDYPATAKGEFFFNREGHRGMDFEISAPEMDLTNWYGPWREAPDDMAYAPLAAGRKPFIKSTTHAVLHVGKTKLRRYDFTKHDAEFLFENWKGPDNILYCPGLSAEGYQGQGFAQGKLVFPRGGGKMNWDFHIVTRHVEVKDFLEAALEGPCTVSGWLDSDFNLAGTSLRYQTYHGGGHMTVVNPQILDPNLISRIQNEIWLGGLTDLIMPKMEGDFTVQDTYVSSDRMAGGNNMFKFIGKGKVWFNRDLDLDISLQPLGVLDKVPLANRLSRPFDFLSASLLKLHVYGPAKDPWIVPNVLSADKLLELPSLVTSDSKPAANSHPLRPASSPTATPLPGPKFR